MKTEAKLPNFNDFELMGDTILWHDVFNNIDLSVRYIHDKLKVDVIVKQALLKEIRTKIEAGELNPEDYFTIRFDIPMTIIQNMAWQNNRDKDLYAENLELDTSPIEFYKKGNKVHELMLAHTYRINEQGEQLLSYLSMDEPVINTRQLWQLKRDEPGIAELSVQLDDLSYRTDYDVVIDPSATFQNGSGGYTGCADSFLYINENVTDDEYYRTHSNYGAATEFTAWAFKPVVGNWSECRPILRFKNLSSLANKLITGAKLTLYLHSREGSTPASQFRIEPYGIKNYPYNWVAGSGWGGIFPNENWVTWSHIRLYAGNQWASPGGVGFSDRLGSCGTAVDVRTISNPGTAVTWNLDPGIVQGWINESIVGGNGFVMECIDKMTNYSNILQYVWHSSDSSTASYRPTLEITYHDNPVIANSIDLINFDGLGYPMPDGVTAPVKIGNKWYAYIQNHFNYNTPPTATGTPYTISKEFLVYMAQSTNGMATSDINNIKNNLVRYNAARTPQPMATGTPYPVWGGVYPQFQPSIPVSPDDWYNRKASIFANYVEYNASPTPSPVRLHSFAHTEDTHDGWGHTYGSDSTGHINYQRIGYLRSDGINFTPVPANASDPDVWKRGPAIECFISELEWVYPLGTPTGTPSPVATYAGMGLESGIGARHPNMVEHNGYFYLFYDRRLSERVIAPRLTATPSQDLENLKKSLIQHSNGSYSTGTTDICVARASKSALLAYQPNGSYNNPWQKFFDGSFSQPGYRGWSSPVIVLEATTQNNRQFRHTPQVTFNPFLNSHIMLCHGIDYNNQHYVFLYVPLDDSLTKWSSEIRIDVAGALDYINASPSQIPIGAFKNSDLLYPYLINNDTGNDKGRFTKSGAANYIYFTKMQQPTPVPTNLLGLARTTFQLQN